MVKKDVTIGATYNCKVSGKLTTVKIMATSEYGGWNGRNTRTGREVRIKTARRLYRMSQDFNVVRDNTFLTDCGGWSTERADASVFPLITDAIRAFCASGVDGTGVKIRKAK